MFIFILQRVWLLLVMMLVGWFARLTLWHTNMYMFCVCTPQILQYFGQTLRPALRQQHPEASVTELAKLIGQKWRELTEDGKFCLFCFCFRSLFLFFPSSPNPPPPYLLLLAFLLQTHARTSQIQQPSLFFLFFLFFSNCPPHTYPPCIYTHTHPNSHFRNL